MTDYVMSSLAASSGPEAGRWSTTAMATLTDIYIVNVLPESCSLTQYTMVTASVQNAPGLHCSVYIKPTTGYPLSHPDIEYHPNREKWHVRTARRLLEDPSLPTTPLPTGFPKKLDSPLVWEGKDWQSEK